MNRTKAFYLDKETSAKLSYPLQQIRTIKTQIKDLQKSLKQAEDHVKTLKLEFIQQHTTFKIGSFVEKPDTKLGLFKIIDFDVRVYDYNDAFHMPLDAAFINKVDDVAIMAICLPWMKTKNEAKNDNVQTFDISKLVFSEVRY